MKKILLLLLTVSLGFFSLGGKTGISSANNVNNRVQKATYTYLICGLDNAAENTDAIVLFNYDTESNTASFLQIPRDTYIEYSHSISKINSIYPSLRSKGCNEQEAMSELSSAISDALGIDIDGYVCYTVMAFANLVNAIGGVDIKLPMDVTISDSDGDNRLELKRGVSPLDGEAAARFVRYRSGYALGDLGRVDAQKFFLSAFMKKLKNSINIKVVSQAALSSHEGILTNLKLMDILRIGLKMRGRIAEASICFANIPGVAKADGRGVWYYYVNKKASMELISCMRFSLKDEFDKNKKLVSRKSDDLTDLYYNENTVWRLIREEELGSLEVKER